jgi:signal transduction histidine kinase
MQALAETGGEIEVTTRRTSSGAAEISIADNGPGIPTRLRDRIFDPGISGKGGIGLGLWLVETFIHQFDGRIAFTSVEGEGTTFVVTLQPMQGSKVAR